MTSGTASIHTAVAAIDPEPGDEIITTPITDMGAIAPILYQTAIPIFADVDPLTYNVTAETIAARITPRTRAIIVTHLFGNPCDMGPIMALAGEHGIPVIEDAAQAFLAECDGAPGRHDRRHRLLQPAAGQAHDDRRGRHRRHPRTTSYARWMWLFIDKAWGYGDPKPDHYFLALNYRMTELQGAVALAQLDKLDGVVARRIRVAELLTERLAGIAGRPARPVPRRAASTSTGSTRCASTTT